MKNFLLITLILALFTGCSSSNAFSKFNLTPEQAKSENSILSSKIHFKGKTVGIISALYLNQVFPKVYNENAWFYVSVYTKNSEDNLNFFLNGEKTLSIKKLHAENKFSNLISLNENWKTYYLLQFKQPSNALSFVAKNSLYSSDALIYTKED